MELDYILSKMENEGWQIDPDFKEAHKHFLQYFLETVEEQCNIANVRLSCFQEIWQKWCESKSTQEFDEWLHAQMHEA